MFTSSINVEVEMNKNTGLFTLRVANVFIGEYSSLDKAICAVEEMVDERDTLAVVTIIGTTAVVESSKVNVSLVYERNCSKGKMAVVITEDAILVKLNGNSFNLPSSDRKLSKRYETLESLAETVGTENATVEISCGILKTSPMKWEKFKEMVSIMN